MHGEPGTMGEDDLLEIIWPATGLHTRAIAPRRDRDQLGEDDEIALSIDNLTLRLSPLEFIQLASFLRMTIDELLSRHPGLQRNVVEAFDIPD